jgi:excisionase family DNA binding protein
MAAVTIADAARLLGKPERTGRRWAAKGKLPATRTDDSWLIELELDEHGQLAATVLDNGHTNGHVSATTAVTGGQVAAMPVSYLRELQQKAESVAYWQGRCSILEARIEELKALPPAPVESKERAPWWAPWRWRTA